jgi:hypothetical protein
MGGFRELTLNAHKLLTDTRLAGNSTDTKPTVDEEGGELPVGREWFAEDTGSPGIGTARNGYGPTTRKRSTNKRNSSSRSVTF